MTPEEIDEAYRSVESEIIITTPATDGKISIEHNGKIILTEDIETAIDIANEIATEHFELCVDDPFA